MFMTGLPHIVRHGIRLHSTNVAIIGSGPAGFYTAFRLLKKNEDVKVDIFEKLPVPYGLSRYGVAPDHPEVKNCQDTFKQLGDLSNFKFFGNVEVGKDITLQQLKDNYNCIVFSYGCNDDNIGGLADVPGINSKGVITARKFVGWYNGLPELQHLDPPLEKVEDVIIIGNGNVALDVTRALLQPIDVWKRTDMTKNAIAKLARSSVKNVRIVGRRGFLESAFTNKEFRELIELKKHGIIFNFKNPDQLRYLAPLASQMGRIQMRRLEMISRVMNLNKELDKDDIKKTWMLDYLKSPVEIHPSYSDPDILESTTFVLNKLKQDSPVGSPEIVRTTKSVTYKNELLITSTGYKGTPLPGFKEMDILFSPITGTIGNIDGRIVADSDYSQFLKGFYTSGWISVGALGVILSTMMNAFNVADVILQDLNSFHDEESKAGSDGVVHILNQKGVKFVNWRGWQKIEKYEFEKGSKMGKIREKICDVDEMLNVLWAT